MGKPVYTTPEWDEMALAKAICSSVGAILTDFVGNIVWSSAFEAWRIMILRDQLKMPFIRRS